MFRVPEEIEQLIWQSYVRHHVLPLLRKPTQLEDVISDWANRFRAGRFDHPSLHQTVLDTWIEWIACHAPSFDSFLETMARLPEDESTCVYESSEGFVRFLWWIDDSHGLSASQHAADRLFVSYHTPDRFESAVVYVWDTGTAIGSRSVHRLIPYDSHRS